MYYPKMNEKMCVLNLTYLKNRVPIDSQIVELLFHKNKNS